MTVTQLREKRASLIDQARNDFNSIKTPTKEDEQRLTGLLDEADRLTSQIRLEGYEENLRNVDPRVTTSRPLNQEPGDEWRDERGNRIAVAGRGQSLAQEVRHIRGSVGGEHRRIGEVMRGIIVGQDEDRAASVGLAVNAGYIADETLSAQVIDLARNKSRVAQAGAQFIAMPTSELSMVRVDSDPTASWVGEGSTIPKSSSTFGRMTFRARKMATIVEISRELAEDAPNAASVLEQQLGEKFALELDRAALDGDADGEEPTGVFNTTGISTAAVSGSLDYDDFIDGIAAIEGVNGEPNAMLYSAATNTLLNKLKDANNRYLTPPPTFSDVQRYTTNQIDDTKAIIGDFSQLMIGVRSSVQFDRGYADAGFDKDLVAVRVTWRGDIQVARPNHFHAITGIS